ncbi:MAG: LacI family DNA-binding transcriptional regulator [Nitrososphaerales archaeon]
MARVTIHDVARLAAVSPKTVSNVVNRPEMVSPETRARVERAIAELRYQPNAAARHLVTGRSGVIGLLISDITNPAYPEMVEHVVMRAKESGYSVIVCNTQSDAEHVADYIELLIQQSVDGVVMTTASRLSDAAQRLNDRDIPVGLANRAIENARVDYIGADNFRGGYLATQHLIKLGHQRIAHVHGTLDASTSLGRSAGYRSALEKANLPFQAELLVGGDYSRVGGYTAARALMALKQAPTAIFCANDVTALGVMDALSDLGFRIPEDVAIVGFDDIPFASLRSIGLTTVHTGYARIAQEALDLLLYKIAHNEEPASPEVTCRIHPVHLVVRRTCGADPAWRCDRPDTGQAV